MRLLIATLAAAILMGLLIFQMGQKVTLYVDFATARHNPAKEYHVVASWIQREKAIYDPREDAFYFYAQDTLGGQMWVRYPDPKPINFETAARVVLIGKVQDTLFHADKILMKCPSKYKEEI
ncbi:MAG: cytochrome c maturation protein CcmE domain-containing protein [Bacteroidia bacterium]